MNSVWLLLKVQLRNLYGFNTALHGGSGKKKTLFFLGVFVLVPYLVAVVFFYCWTMAGAMPEGPAGILPLMLVVTIMLTLITAIYRAGGTLFAFRDYDLVMSLPVRTSAVAISRLMMLYIMELGFTLMIMLPAGAVYVIMAAPAWPFYPLYILCVLVSPVAPLVVGSLLGALVTAFTSRLKRFGTVFNTVFSLVFVLAVMYLSMSMSGDPSRLAAGGSALSASIGRFYPLLGLFNGAVIGFDIPAFLLYFFISAALLFGTGFLLSTRYKAINTRLMSSGASGKKYRMGELRTSTPARALYRRDMRSYFASSAYVMNTAFGFILSIIACAALLIVGTDKISSLVGPQLTLLLTRVAPAFMALLIGMAPTTYCAISLEGRGLWITKSLPVSAAAVFRSKLLVNLTLAVPTVLIDGALLCLALRPDTADCILMFLLPVSAAVFSAVLGLVVNLWLPKLDWTNEMTVVKQSASCLVTVLFGMAAGIALIVVSALAPMAQLILYILCGVILLGSLLMWLWLCRGGARRFAEL